MLFCLSNECGGGHSAHDLIFVDKADLRHTILLITEELDEQIASPGKLIAQGFQAVLGVVPKSGNQVMEGMIL